MNGIGTLGTPSAVSAKGNSERSKLEDAPAQTISSRSRTDIPSTHTEPRTRTSSSRNASAQMTANTRVLFGCDVENLRLTLDNVVINDMRVLRRMHVVSHSDQPLRVRLRSTLGTQLKFQLSNLNLPDDRDLSHGPHLNSLFNLVGWVDELVLPPRATQQIILVFLAEAHSSSEDGPLASYKASEINGSIVLTGRVIKDCLIDATECNHSSTEASEQNSGTTTPSAEAQLDPQKSLGTRFSALLTQSLSIRFKALVCQSILRVDQAEREMDLDDCVTNQTYVRDFTVWNCSEFPLSFVLATDSTDGQGDLCEFSELETGYPINPKREINVASGFSQCRIRLSYSPTTVGEFKMVLQLENLRNLSNVERITVHASVTAEQRSQALWVSGGGRIDFGDVYAHRSAEWTIILRNETVEPIDVFAIPTDGTSDDGVPPEITFHHPSVPETEEDYDSPNDSDRPHTPARRGANPEKHVNNMGGIKGDSTESLKEFNRSQPRAHSRTHTPLMQRKDARDGPGGALIGSNRRGRDHHGVMIVDSEDDDRRKEKPRRESTSQSSEQFSLLPNREQMVVVRYRPIELGDGSDISSADVESTGGISSVTNQPQQKTQNMHQQNQQAKQLYQLQTRNYRLRIKCCDAAGAEIQWRVIHATARVCLSKVMLSMDELNFGDLIIGKHYSKTISLRNLSALPASIDVRYQSKIIRLVELHDDQDDYEDTTDAPPPSGGIASREPPHSFEGVTSIFASGSGRGASQIMSITIPPLQQINIRVDVRARKVNPEYVKHIHFSNTNNDEDSHTLIVRANNIDQHGDSFHSVIYRVTTGSPLGDINFATMVNNNASLRTFKIKSLHSEQLHLDLFTTRPSQIKLYTPKLPGAFKEGSGVSSGDVMGIDDGMREGTENRPSTNTQERLLRRKEKLLESMETDTWVDDAHHRDSTRPKAYSVSKAEGRSVDFEYLDLARKAEPKSPGTIALQRIQTDLDALGRTHPSPSIRGDMTRSPTQSPGPPSQLTKQRYYSTSPSSPRSSVQSSRGLSMGLRNSGTRDNKSHPRGDSERGSGRSLSRNRGISSGRNSPSPSRLDAYDNGAYDEARNSAGTGKSTWTGGSGGSGQPHQKGKGNALDTHKKGHMYAPGLSRGSTGMHLAMPTTDSKAGSDTSHGIASDGEGEEEGAWQLTRIVQSFTEEQFLPSHSLSPKDEIDFIQHVQRRRWELQRAILDGRLAEISMVTLEQNEEITVYVVYIPSLHGSSSNPSSRKLRKIEEKLLIRPMYWNPGLNQFSVLEPRDEDTSVDGIGTDPIALGPPIAGSVKAGRLSVSIAVRQLRLLGKACTSAVSVGQKYINFGHLTLKDHVAQVKTLVINNNTELPMLYKVVKSGSIASGDLQIREGRAGVVKPFDKRGVNFMFKPTFAGVFKETLKIVNVLDETSQEEVTVKALVKSPKAFMIKSLFVDFGCLVIGQRSKAASVVVTNNTANSRQYVIRLDRGMCTAIAVQLDFEFEEANAEDEGLISQQDLEKIEGLEQKLKIAIRKEQHDKKKEIEGKLKKLKAPTKGAKGKKLKKKSLVLSATAGVTPLTTPASTPARDITPPISTTVSRSASVKESDLLHAVDGTTMSSQVEGGTGVGKSGDTGFGEVGRVADLGDHTRSGQSESVLLAPRATTPPSVAESTGGIGAGSSDRDKERTTTNGFRLLDDCTGVVVTIDAMSARGVTVFVTARALRSTDYTTNSTRTDSDCGDSAPADTSVSSNTRAASVTGNKITLREEQVRSLVRKRWRWEKLMSLLNPHAAVTDNNTDAGDDPAATHMQISVPLVAMGNDAVSADNVSGAGQKDDVARTKLGKGTVSNALAHDGGANSTLNIAGRGQESIAGCNAAGNAEPLKSEGQADEEMPGTFAAPHPYAPAGDISTGATAPTVFSNDQLRTACASDTALSQLGMEFVVGGLVVHEDRNKDLLKIVAYRVCVCSTPSAATGMVTDICTAEGSQPLDGLSASASVACLEDTDTTTEQNEPIATVQESQLSPQRVEAPPIATRLASKIDPLFRQRLQAILAMPQSSLLALSGNTSTLLSTTTPCSPISTPPRSPYVDARNLRDRKLSILNSEVFRSAEGGAGVSDSTMIGQSSNDAASFIAASASDNGETAEESGGLEGLVKSVSSSSGGDISPRTNFCNILGRKVDGTGNIGSSASSSSMLDAAGNSFATPGRFQRHDDKTGHVDVTTPGNTNTHSGDPTQSLSSPITNVAVLASEAQGRALWSSSQESLMTGRSGDIQACNTSPPEECPVAFDLSPKGVIDGGQLDVGVSGEKNLVMRNTHPRNALYYLVMIISVRGVSTKLTGSVAANLNSATSSHSSTRSLLAGNEGIQAGDPKDLKTVDISPASTSSASRIPEGDLGHHKNLGLGAVADTSGTYTSLNEGARGTIPNPQQTLAITPSEGQLEPGESANITIRLDDSRLPGKHVYQLLVQAWAQSSKMELVSSSSDVMQPAACEEAVVLQIVRKAPQYIMFAGIGADSVPTRTGLESGPTQVVDLSPPENLLKLPPFFVSPYQRYSLVHPITVTSIYDEPLWLSCSSNLAQQVWIFANESLTTAADCVSLPAMKSVTVYLGLSPNVRLESLEGGECRELVGGVRFSIYGQRDEGLLLSTLQAGEGCKEGLADNHLLGTETLKISAKFGMSIMSVDPRYVKMGATRNIGEAATSSITIYNHNREMPASYAILAPAGLKCVPNYGTLAPRGDGEGSRVTVSVTADEVFIGLFERNLAILNRNNPRQTLRVTVRRFVDEGCLTIDLPFLRGDTIARLNLHNIYLRSNNLGENCTRTDDEAHGDPKFVEMKSHSPDSGSKLPRGVTDLQTQSQTPPDHAQAQTQNNVDKYGNMHADSLHRSEWVVGKQVVLAHKVGDLIFHTDSTCTFSLTNITDKPLCLKAKCNLDLKLSWGAVKNLEIGKLGNLTPSTIAPEYRKAHAVPRQDAVDSKGSGERSLSDPELSAVKWEFCSKWQYIPPHTRVEVSVTLPAPIRLGPKKSRRLREGRRMLQYGCILFENLKTIPDGLADRVRELNGECSSSRPLSPRYTREDLMMSEMSDAGSFTINDADGLSDESSAGAQFGISTLNRANYGILAPLQSPVLPVSPPQASPNVAQDEQHSWLGLNGLDLSTYSCTIVDLQCHYGLSFGLVSPSALPMGKVGHVSQWNCVRETIYVRNTAELPLVFSLATDLPSGVTVYAREVTQIHSAEDSQKPVTLAGVLEAEQIELETGAVMGAGTPSVDTQGTSSPDLVPLLIGELMSLAKDEQRAFTVEITPSDLKDGLAESGLHTLYIAFQNANTWQKEYQTNTENVNDSPVHVQGDHAAIADRTKVQQSAIGSLKDPDSETSRPTRSDTKVSADVRQGYAKVPAADHARPRPHASGETHAHARSRLHPHHDDDDTSDDPMVCCVQYEMTRFELEFDRLAANHELHLPALSYPMTIVSSVCEDWFSVVNRYGTADTPARLTSEIQVAAPLQGIISIDTCSRESNNPIAEHKLALGDRLGIRVRITMNKDSTLPANVIQILPKTADGYQIGTIGFRTDAEGAVVSSSPLSVFHVALIGTFQRERAFDIEPYHLEISTHLEESDEDDDSQGDDDGATDSESDVDMHTRRIKADTQASAVCTCSAVCMCEKDSREMSSEQKSISGSRGGRVGRRKPRDRTVSTSSMNSLTSSSPVVDFQSSMLKAQAAFEAPPRAMATFVLTNRCVERMLRYNITPICDGWIDFTDEGCVRMLEIEPALGEVPPNESVTIRVTLACDHAAHIANVSSIKLCIRDHDGDGEGSEVQEVPIKLVTVSGASRPTHIAQPIVSKSESEVMNIKNQMSVVSTTDRALRDGITSSGSTTGVRLKKRRLLLHCRGSVVDSKGTDCYRYDAALGTRALGSGVITWQFSLENTQTRSQSFRLHALVDSDRNWLSLGASDGQVAPLETRVVTLSLSTGTLGWCSAYVVVENVHHPDEFFIVRLRMDVVVSPDRFGRNGPIDRLSRQLQPSSQAQSHSQIHLHEAGKTAVSMNGQGEGVGSEGNTGDESTTLLTAVVDAHSGESALSTSRMSGMDHTIESQTLSAKNDYLDAEDFFSVITTPTGTGTSTATPVLPGETAALSGTNNTRQMLDIGPVYAGHTHTEWSFVISNNSAVGAKFVLTQSAVDMGGGVDSSTAKPTDTSDPGSKCSGDLAIDTDHYSDCDVVFSLSRESPVLCNTLYIPSKEDLRVYVYFTPTLSAADTWRLCAASASHAGEPGEARPSVRMSCTINISCRLIKHFQRSIHVSADIRMPSLNVSDSIVLFRGKASRSTSVESTKPIAIYPQSQSVYISSTLPPALFAQQRPMELYIRCSEPYFDVEFKETSSSIAVLCAGNPQTEIYGGADSGQLPASHSQLTVVIKPRLDTIAEASTMMWKERYMSFHFVVCMRNNLDEMHFVRVQLGLSALASSPYSVLTNGRRAHRDLFLMSTDLVRRYRLLLARKHALKLANPSEEDKDSRTLEMELLADYMYIIRELTLFGLEKRPMPMAHLLATLFFVMLLDAPPFKGSPRHLLQQHKHHASLQMTPRGDESVIGSLPGVSGTSDGSFSGSIGPASGVESWPPYLQSWVCFSFQRVGVFSITTAM
ncbi:hypothetical protein SARC_02843 [Sphaeroforma arctica JP610]|uniref:Uncharacterized protein n=1 Tax=Sphaeroforma arctica JP610 TaxID=667725 RepID=A0A0L0G7D5_9EUKA|nr:hypothetical protein SARC_02843 [Sphaeroforma arctica JP610]KNC84952.1 hypothetical protein SARC_02843 [Sphaeroforma arctica JP610]|eukprot:XP_014158854.1 hypothetical protein SARC_02843 [Sphaeroforma arctica JP610]